MTNITLPTGPQSFTDSLIPKVVQGKNFFSNSITFNPIVMSLIIGIHLYMMYSDKRGEK